MAELLTSAAELAGSVRLAALAARVMQTISLACVATGVPADGEPGISKGGDGSRSAGEKDSWHLTVSQYGHLTRLCLRLAQRHPSLGLLQSLVPPPPPHDEQALFPWEGRSPLAPCLVPPQPQFYTVSPVIQQQCTVSRFPAVSHFAESKKNALIF